MPSLRPLLRAPALSLGVVLTLAFGVGALTTTFALLDAALLREPPFPDAGELAVLKLVRHPVGEPERQEHWSFARFRALRERQRSFAQLATFTNPSFTLAGARDDDEPELVTGEV